MSGQKTTSIVRFAVERKVTMGMAVLGVLVLGWISLQRLPLEYLPSFSSHNVSVNAPYPSSSPEEVERLTRQIREWRASLSQSSEVKARSMPLDVQAREDLRALGYVD